MVNFLYLSADFLKLVLISFVVASPATLLTIGFKAVNAATANPVRSLRAD